MRVLGKNGNKQLIREKLNKKIFLLGNQLKKKSI